MARRLDINSEAYKLGQQIRKYRTFRNMTQDQLGELVGTNRANIGKYENGLKGEMGYHLLKRFAQALGIPLCVLTCEDDSLSELLETVTALNEQNRAVAQTTVKALLYMQLGTERSEHD